MKALALVLLAAGCGGVPEAADAPVPTPPTWESAESRAWTAYREAFKNVNPTPPTVELVTGSDLNCTNDFGRGFLVQGECKHGAFWARLGDRKRVVRFAAPQDELTWVETIMVAHEFLHAALYDSRHDEDHDHLGPEWQPGGLMERVAAGLN